MSHKLLKNNLKLKFYLVCSFLLLLTITLIVLPGNYFDNGNSKCVSVLLFDKQCYGCGMTRAIQHLIHFDLFVFLSLFEIRKMYLSLIEETEI